MHRFFNAAIAAIALALPALSLTAIAQERFTATVTGQGPDVILIPGLASSGAVWDATVKQLSPTHRVHVLQVNGFAGSPPGPNADGAVIAPLTAEIAAYAGKLDHPAIIGHSMGGLMALKIAAAKPAAAGKPSTADILAAARAKGVAAAAKPAGDEAAKATPSAKPSTAEILARARAAKAPPGPEAAEPPSEIAPQAPIPKPAAVAKKPSADGARPTTTAEKLAWCRAHDAQG